MASYQLFVCMSMVVI